MFDWVLSVMQSAGYAGRFAGFLSATGEMNAVIGGIVVSIGATLGATLRYYPGLWIGTHRLRRFADRRGKRIGLRPAVLDKADGWFRHHGGKVVFSGRKFPGIRTFISFMPRVPVARLLSQCGHMQLAKETAPTTK